MYAKVLGLILVLVAGQGSIPSAQGGSGAVFFQPEITESSAELPGNWTSLVLAKRERKNSDVRVTLYMTSWCPYCRQAREYLKGLGVRLTEYDVEKSPSKMAEMKKLNGGSAGVPLISVEGILIPGFAPDAIKEAVEKRKKSEVKG